MELKIDARDLDALRKSLPQFSDRRFAAGLATALTRTAQAVRDAEQREMRDVFDRPTRYTLGSVFVQPARADQLQAVVGIKDQASEGRAPIKWLRWQITGGLRRLTALERQLVGAGAMDGGDRAVPGRFAKLDAFGNISRGQIGQILSQLRIETGRLGSARTMPRFAAEDTPADQRRKRAAIIGQHTKAGGRYVAFPYGRGKLRSGIYLFSAWERNDPKCVLRFVSSAEYEAIFDFGYVAINAARRVIGHEVQRAMADHLRRVMARQGRAA